MPRKSKRKRWSLQEVSDLKKYIQSKSDLLINNFYENVLEGKMKVRKPPGFFIQMAETLNMKPKQCKSKFQKFEREIYTNYLSLPEAEYQVFLHLRKKNFFNKKFKSSAQSKSGKTAADFRRPPARRAKRAQEKAQPEATGPSDEAQQQTPRAWTRMELFELRKTMIAKFKLKKANELVVRESKRAWTGFRRFSIF